MQVADLQAELGRVNAEHRAELGRVNAKLGRVSAQLQALEDAVVGLGRAPADAALPVHSSVTIAPERALEAAPLRQAASLASTDGELLSASVPAALLDSPLVDLF